MASTTHSIAAEVRAELGRHNRKVADVARALDCSYSTAWRKCHAHSPLIGPEIGLIADMLGVSAGRFYSSDTEASVVSDAYDYSYAEVAS